MQEIANSALAASLQAYHNCSIHQTVDCPGILLVDAILQPEQMPLLRDSSALILERCLE